MRRVVLNDANRILSFCLALKAEDARMSFTSLDTLEEVRSQILDSETYLFITLDGEHVTSMFRGIRGVENKAHSCYVACAVKKEYRKKSLATAVTNYGLDVMKKEGVLIARTKIYSWNKASIATILKCGFEEAGRVYMHQYEPTLHTYIDDLLFHKVL